MVPQLAALAAIVFLGTTVAAWSYTEAKQIQFNADLVVVGEVRTNRLCIGGVCRTDWPEGLQSADLGAAGVFQPGFQDVACSTACNCVPIAFAGCNWMTQNNTGFPGSTSEIDPRNILNIVSVPNLCYTGYRDSDGNCAQWARSYTNSYQCDAPWTTSFDAIAQRMQGDCSIIVNSPSKPQCVARTCRYP